MKVVINICYGGFSLSTEAIQRYFDIKGQQVWIEEDTFGPNVYLVHPEQRQPEVTPSEWAKMTMEQRQEHNRVYSEQNWSSRELERTDPVLVQVVEELGSDADGNHAHLKVVEVPDDVQWTIEEYDGSEWVAEVHRTWS